MIFETLLTSAASVFLLIVILHLVAAFYGTSRKRKISWIESSSPSKNLKEISTPPSGPFPLPILGNLHNLAKYEDNPYAGFTEMAKTYGPIYSLQMGSTPSIVVSSLKGIREVLISKGNSFSDRPNFARWNYYFDGNRQHSLALCDFSPLQEARRKICRSFLLIKQLSDRYRDLDSWLGSEMFHLLDALKNSEGNPSLVKVPLSYCAINVFFGYMCSTRFDYSEKKFQEVTKCFDLIFEDINNGHPTDFLPQLTLFYKYYKDSISDRGHKIRNFIEKEIIGDRPEHFDANNVNDPLDALLANYFNTTEGKMSMDWQNILFVLEDLLGGSSAISNFVMRILYYVAKHKNVQEKLHNEIDDIIGSERIPSLDDRPNMNYSMSVILESLRMTSSPIVPHVANENTTVEGYFVEKGTMVFLNNYELNMSTSLWENPSEFQPERFISNNQIKKPEYYMPFSTGKRTCVGQTILQSVSFVTVATILQRYSISLPEGENIEVPKGKLALVGDGFPLILTPRF